MSLVILLLFESHVLDCTDTDWSFGFAVLRLKFSFEFRLSTIAVLLEGEEILRVGCCRLMLFPGGVVVKTLRHWWGCSFGFRFGSRRGLHFGGDVGLLVIECLVIGALVLSNGGVEWSRFVTE